MAKLKYDRPINITLNASGSTMVPKGEVWKVSTNAYGDGSEYHTNLYGGVYNLHSLQLSGLIHLRHRLQTRRRVSDSMEVVLHG